MKQTVRNLTELNNKRVFVRVDFNVPQDESGAITDDTRIVEVLPTIQYLLGQQAKIIVASHLGRPKGQVKESLRLTPIYHRLQELLPGAAVYKSDDVFSPTVVEQVNRLKAGEILLLENLRFEAGEEANDPAFAKNLASLADIYVNDAFGAAHRAHASIEGITHYVDTSVAGFLMEKEITALTTVMENPQHPYTAIIGGSKVSTKISILKNLIHRVDNLVIGGGMMFTFLKAQGYTVGNSLVEDDYIDTAKDLMAFAQENDTYLKLPKNIIIADAFKGDANTQVNSQCNIPDGWMGLDIAPESVEVLKQIIFNSKTILWNGPLGVFEIPAFANGTRQIAEAIAEWTQQCGGQSILGGGDTVAAIEQFGLKPDQFTHVSTGGGASLEFMEGKTLPGIAALNDATASAVG